MKNLKYKPQKSKPQAYNVERIADSKNLHASAIRHGGSAKNFGGKRYPLNAKIFLFLVSTFCILNFMGCATYKFQRGKEPYHKSYVVSRDDYIIPEYTIGKDNSLPNLELARERFKKRKNMVEHYYKKMGYIQNNLKMTFWDPPVLFLKFIGGVFRLPSVAISDYKYEHNPQYREKIIKMQQERDAKEEARIQKLKEELNAYIQKELTQEHQG